MNEKRMRKMKEKNGVYVDGDDTLTDIDLIHLKYATVQQQQYNNNSETK